MTTTTQILVAPSALAFTDRGVLVTVSADDLLSALDALTRPTAPVAVLRSIERTPTEEVYTCGEGYLGGRPCCGRSLPVSAFGDSTRREGGRDRRCRECYNADKRERDARVRQIERSLGVDEKTARKVLRAVEQGQGAA